jgi:hypothetical protein
MGAALSARYHQGRLRSRLAPSSCQEAGGRDRPSRKLRAFEEIARHDFALGSR